MWHSLCVVLGVVAQEARIRERMMGVICFIVLVFDCYLCSFVGEYVVVGFAWVDVDFGGGEVWGVEGVE